MTALVVILAGSQLLAQGADAFLGSWVLDPAQSTFSGAAPDKRTMKFEKVADGIQHTTETVNLQGFVEDIYKLQYTFKVDGKDYKADPQMPVSTVSFKQIDANTIERTGKYLGAVIETVTYKLSADGKVLTLNQSAMQGGAQITSTQVFTRQ